MNTLNRTILAATLLGLLMSGCASPGPGAGAAAPPPPTSAEAGGQTIVAIAAPSPPQQTLPQWLGINDLFNGIGALIRCKDQLLAPLFPQLATGLPFLQPPPLLKSITDPSNLSEDAPPVVQAAAEAKMEEDAALQKIAAIEALKRIGCVKGRPNVEKGLLASLDDPTEKVRYAAVSALHELSGHPCETCQSGQCCSPAIYKKLHEIATKESKPGCFVEPSARVRRLARLAMMNCGTPPTPAPPEKIEGPTPPLPSPPEKIEGPLPPPPAPAAGDDPTAKLGKPTPTNQSPTVVPAAHETKQPESHKPEKEPVITQTSHTTAAKTSPKAESAEMHGEKGTLKWERMTAPSSQFRSRQDAYATIAYLRSRALGIKTERVPRFQRNQLQIQAYDWGKLKADLSPVIARSLKSLPVGQISPILEDGAGFHIVRVLGRRKPDSPVETAKPAPARPAEQTPVDTKTSEVQPKVVPAKKTEVVATPTVESTETKPKSPAIIEPPMPPITQASAETQPERTATVVEKPNTPKETVTPAVHVAEPEPPVEPAIIPSALAAQPDRNTFRETQPRDITATWRNTIAADARRNAYRTVALIQPPEQKPVPQATVSRPASNSPAFPVTSPVRPIASSRRSIPQPSQGYSVAQPDLSNTGTTQRPATSQTATRTESPSPYNGRYALRPRSDRHPNRPVEMNSPYSQPNRIADTTPESQPRRRGNVYVSESRPSRSQPAANNRINTTRPIPHTISPNRTERKVVSPEPTTQHISPIQRTTHISPATHTVKPKPAINHAEFTRPQDPRTHVRPATQPDTKAKPVATIRSTTPRKIQSRQNDASKRDLFSDFDKPTDPKKIAEARVRALKESLRKPQPNGLLKEADFGNWEFPERNEK